MSTRLHYTSSKSLLLDRLKQIEVELQDRINNSVKHFNILLHYNMNSFYDGVNSKKLIYQESDYLEDVINSYYREIRKIHILWYERDDEEIQKHIDDYILKVTDQVFDYFEKIVLKIINVD